MKKIFALIFVSFMTILSLLGGCVSQTNNYDFSSNISDKIDIEDGSGGGGVSASGNWIDYKTDYWEAELLGSPLNYQLNYYIYNAEQFATFCYLVNNDYYYSDSGIPFTKAIVFLRADLDMSAHYWTPIGTSDRPFQGVFFGGEHTIYGLKIMSTLYSGDIGAYGLFGHVKEATIQFVHVSGSISVSANTSSAIVGAIIGGVVGRTVGNTHIVGSSFSGMITVSSATPDSYYNPNVYVGGIVGVLLSQGTIDTCINYSNIYCSKTNLVGAAGGIVGSIPGSEGLSYNMDVTECLNFGDISGFQYTGGIVGRVITNDIAEYIYVTKSVNYGAVSDGIAVGGIVGYANDYLYVNQCVNYGYVSSTSQGAAVGGLVGVAGRVHGTTGSLWWKEDVYYNHSYLITCLNYGKVSCSGDDAIFGYIMGDFYGTIGKIRIEDSESTRFYGSISGETSTNDCEAIDIREMVKSSYVVNFFGQDYYDDDGVVYYDIASTDPYNSDATFYITSLVKRCIRPASLDRGYFSTNHSTIVPATCVSSFRVILRWTKYEQTYVVDSEDIARIVSYSFYSEDVYTQEKQCDSKGIFYIRGMQYYDMFSIVAKGKLFESYTITNERGLFVTSKNYGVDNSPLVHTVDWAKSSIRMGSVGNVNVVLSARSNNVDFNVSVTGDNGTVRIMNDTAKVSASNNSLRFCYKDKLVLNITPSDGYKIKTVKVEGNNISFTDNDNAFFTNEFSFDNWFAGQINASIEVEVEEFEYTYTVKLYSNPEKTSCKELSVKTNDEREVKGEIISSLKGDNSHLRNFLYKNYGSGWYEWFVEYAGKTYDNSGENKVFLYDENEEKFKDGLNSVYSDFNNTTRDFVVNLVPLKYTLSVNALECYILDGPIIQKDVAISSVSLGTSKESINVETLQILPTDSIFLKLECKPGYSFSETNSRFVKVEEGSGIFQRKDLSFPINEKYKSSDPLTLALVFDRKSFKLDLTNTNLSLVENTEKKYFVKTKVDVVTPSNAGEFLGIYSGSNLLTLETSYSFIVDAGEVENDGLDDDSYALSLVAKFGNKATTTSKTISGSEKQVSISSADDLIALSNYVNGGGETSGYVFTQNANIDMAGKVLKPIGTTGSNAFSGTYNGNGFYISNLTLSNASDYAQGGYVGLFGNVSGATIKNLTIKDSNFAGYRYVGSFAGYAVNSRFENLNCFNCAYDISPVVFYDIYGAKTTGSNPKKFTYSYAPTNNSVETTLYTMDRSYFGGIVGLATICSFEGVAFNSNMTINEEEGIVLSYKAVFVGYARSKTLNGNTMTTKIDQCYAEGTFMGVTAFSNDGTLTDYYWENDSTVVEKSIDDYDKWIEVNGKKVLKIFYWVV